MINQNKLQDFLPVIKEKQSLKHLKRSVLNPQDQNYSMTALKKPTHSGRISPLETETQRVK